MIIVLYIACHFLHFSPPWYMWLIAALDGVAVTYRPRPQARRTAASGLVGTVVGVK